MGWWHVLSEALAVGLTVVVGTIAYLLKGRKGGDVEEAASLEAIGRAGKSMIVTNKKDRSGA